MFRVYSLACPGFGRREEFPPSLWCQDPEISGRLGQEEVRAALLREGDVWNSYSTIHSPKKGFIFFFLALSFFFFFSLCPVFFALLPEGELEMCV